MAESVLTPEREAEARGIAALAHASSYEDFLYMARVLVSRPEDRPFEGGEILIRESLYRFGARVVEAAFWVWHGGGTAGEAAPRVIPIGAASAGRSHDEGRPNGRATACSAVVSFPARQPSSQHHGRPEATRTGLNSTE
jgi:hypothetical protein